MKTKIKKSITGLSAALVMLGSECFGPVPPVETISGKVISESFIEGQIVSGDGLFSDGQVVRDLRRDLHTMLVRTNDGRLFSYASNSSAARNMDLRYNVDDPVKNLSTKDTAYLGVTRLE